MNFIESLDYLIEKKVAQAVQKKLTKIRASKAADAVPVTLPSGETIKVRKNRAKEVQELINDRKMNQANKVRHKGLSDTERSANKAGGLTPSGQIPRSVRQQPRSGLQKAKIIGGKTSSAVVRNANKLGMKKKDIQNLTARQILARKHKAEGRGIFSNPSPYRKLPYAELQKLYQNSGGKDKAARKEMEGRAVHILQTPLKQHLQADRDTLAKNYARLRQHTNGHIHRLQRYLDKKVNVYLPTDPNSPNPTVFRPGSKREAIVLNRMKKHRKAMAGLKKAISYRNAMKDQLRKMRTTTNPNATKHESMMYGYRFKVTRDGLVVPIY